MSYTYIYEPIALAEYKEAVAWYRGTKRKGSGEFDNRSKKPDRNNTR